jgi:hypothetical protein
MTGNEALALYNAGSAAVVEALCELNNTVTAQRKQIKDLQIKIAKLSKNSSNSSKRPSSDDITKKPKDTKKGSKKGDRKIGGQPGHDRNVRDPFTEDKIAFFHQHILTSCPVCDGQVDLLDLPPRIIQQMELGDAPIIKHEHRSYPVWCEKCQQIHYMSFPADVVKEGLFKARLTATVAYMKNVCHASFSTIRKFIRDVLGETVSRGYLRKVIEKVSQSLEAPYTELLNRLPFERIVNVDETGHKENGDRFWTWVFKAEMYVLFKIDKSRGSKVLIEVLGKEFDGVLGCDYFSAYRKYMKDFDVRIQFCIAHLIRDIRFLTTIPDKETKAYGQRLLDAVRSMFKVIHNRDAMIAEAFADALEKAKANVMRAALQDVPSRLNQFGKETKREPNNMADRFRTHGKAYFEFITTPEIDPTNNVAEQAIRFIVIDRHVTQGTRSSNGRKSNERIWTVIATCALQGRSAFNFILQAVTAYFNDDPAPSLIPDTS